MENKKKKTKVVKKSSLVKNNKPVKIVKENVRVSKRKLSPKYKKEIPQEHIVHDSFDETVNKISGDVTSPSAPEVKQISGSQQTYELPNEDDFVCGNPDVNCGGNCSCGDTEAYVFQPSIFDFIPNTVDNKIKEEVVKDVKKCPLSKTTQGLITGVIVGSIVTGVLVAISKLKS